MKIIIIFLFTSVGMLLVNLGMDLLTGIQKSETIINMFNPFWVMKPFEYLLLIILTLCTLAYPIILSFRKKHKSKKT
ncbi:hypothetical protein [Halobacillus seohaensis]|uniref:DUF3935 domain-containing protein n=1 Tax=Halobacillus seohaensis TaxID=447421 RepID=A0ABW2EM37_9BACI